MSDNNQQSSDPTERLVWLRGKKAELIAKCEEQIEWLRKVALVLCSREEQQRIVGDFEAHRRKLLWIELEIRKVQSWTGEEDLGVRSDAARLDRELIATFQEAGRWKDNPDV